MKFDEFYLIINIINCNDNDLKLSELKIVIELRFNLNAVS